MVLNLLCVVTVLAVSTADDNNSLRACVTNARARAKRTWPTNNIDRGGRRASDGFWSTVDKRWAFLQDDASAWEAAGFSQASVNATYAHPTDDFHRGVRLVTSRGRLFITVPEQSKLLGKVALKKRLKVFAAATIELLTRDPTLPDVDLVLMLDDVSNPTWPGAVPEPPDPSAPPIFGETRRRSTPNALRHWLVPSFDTFRLEGGDVGDVSPRNASTLGAFWRGTVHLFYGFALGDIIQSDSRINTAFQCDAISDHALAEPVKTRVQFGGGQGNWRRWTVVTTCNHANDHFDFVEPINMRKSSGLRVSDYAGKKRFVKEGPKIFRTNLEKSAAFDPVDGRNIRLDNYGFSDHSQACAHEALLYLDGISTSNGLKYYVACGAPVIFDAAATFEDLIHRGWASAVADARDPRAELRDGVDYLAVGRPSDTYKGDPSRVRAEESRFCRDVAKKVDWIRRNPVEAMNIGARGRAAIAQVGSARAGLEYLATALRAYARLQNFDVPAKPPGCEVKLVNSHPEAVQNKQEGLEDFLVRNAYAELQVTLLGPDDTDPAARRQLFVSPPEKTDPKLFPRRGACSAWRSGADATRAQPPLLVAGQGGSGTRSIVELLRGAGVEMNGGVDTNTWEKDSRAMRLARMDESSVEDDLISLLTPVVGRDGALYDLAGLSRDARRLEIAAVCAFAINMTDTATRAAVTGAPWGWKEPRALFHLPGFQLAFPKFRFVHVARDVRTLSATHLEGYASTWSRWWGKDRMLAEIRDALGVVAHILGPLKSRQGKHSCQHVFRSTVIWRVLFARFWAEEQLTLIRAGIVLGSVRYRLVRLEELTGARGAAKVEELLEWVSGDASAGLSLAQLTALWRETFDGHQSSYRGQRPICDLIIRAMLSTIQQRDEGRIRLLNVPARGFLVRAGALHPSLSKKIGLVISNHIVREVAMDNRDFRQRLAVIAALKGECSTVINGIDLLHTESNVTRSALYALGYPTSRRSTPSVFYRTTKDQEVPGAHARDSSLSLYDSVFAASCSSS